jgi:isopentenyl-diphosphate delta-isomerase
LAKIEAVCRRLAVPVVVKEVGAGFSAEVARQLAEAGVSALDVAGAGGTSWSEVERLRAPDTFHDRVAAQFVRWGIPTAESLRMVKACDLGLPLIASGGISSGVDVAKCIALGADAVSVAFPLLRPALVSAQAVVDELSVILQALRIAMFCIGAPDLCTLQNTPHLQELA